MSEKADQSPHAKVPRTSRPRQPPTGRAASGARPRAATAAHPFAVSTPRGWSWPSRPRGSVPVTLHSPTLRVDDRFSTSVASPAGRYPDAMADRYRHRAEERRIWLGRHRARLPGGRPDDGVPALAAPAGLPVQPVLPGDRRASGSTRRSQDAPVRRAGHRQLGRLLGPSPRWPVLTIFLVGIAYSLVVPGRPRTYAKLAISVLIGLFCLARLYLGVEHPGDALLAVALGVAIPVTAFRFFTPNEVFPVAYRRGKTAHVDVTGRAGRGDQAGPCTTAGADGGRGQAVGLESSAGSTPLRLQVAGDPDEYLFAKLYTRAMCEPTLVQAVRTILYGSLETSLPSRRCGAWSPTRTTPCACCKTIGVRTARPYGIVEITPEREYLLVTEFFEGAVEIGEAAVDDGLIDQGLAMIRRLWTPGSPTATSTPAISWCVAGNCCSSTWHSPGASLALAAGGSTWATYAGPRGPHRPQARLPAGAAPVHASRTGRGLRSHARGGEPDAVARVHEARPARPLAEFRKLAPQRRPIVLQRWSTRRCSWPCACSR